MDRREFLLAGAGVGGSALTYGGPALVLTPNAFAAAPRAPRATAAAAPAIDIPERVLVALKTPDPGVGMPGGTSHGMKHTTSAYHPPSGKIYFTAGDFSGPPYGGSYRQDTFALDVAARFANRATRNAGWSLEYPYAGYGGASVQPKHPDTVSFTWDPNRGVFWMVSGLLETAGTGPSGVPGETLDKVSDPNFIFYKSMTFRPSAAPASRWTNTGFDWARYSNGAIPYAPSGSPDNRHAVYDPLRDVVLVPALFGSGTNLGVLNCASGVWSYYNLGGWGGYAGVQRGSHLAADFVGRKVYHVACTGSNYTGPSNTAHLVSFNMDPPYASHDHGAVPEQPTINAFENCYVTWDSVNSLLLYIPWTVPDTSPPNQVWSATQGLKNLYAFRPATGAWETIPVVTDPPGTYFTLRSACFDPVNNVHVFTGGVNDVDPNSNLFLFRYRALPSWLNGKPLNQWIPIAGTELRDSDVSAQAAAGLTSSYGRANQGIFDYSGAALKTSTSEVLVFGGGGAAAWAGNDVRSLKLSDDVPRWKTVVKPSPSTAVWSAAAGSPEKVAHPRMKDGKPNARHSARQPQFIDSRNQFMAFGCQQVWETDNGSFPSVDSVPLNTGVWNPAGTHPDLPFSLWGPPGWAVKHPDTEAVYVSTYNRVAKWSPGTNSWSIAFNNNVLNWLGLGPADIDPNRNVILQLSPQTSGGPWRAAAIDVVAGTLTTGALVGPYAGQVVADRNCGLVFDRGLGRFLLYQDQAQILTLAPNSGGPDWYVDKLALTGSPPPIGAYTSGHSGIWTRMQYVPALKGVVLVLAYNQPAYFIRTAIGAPPPPPTAVAPGSVSIARNPPGQVSAGTVVVLTASCAVGTAPINYLWSTGQTGTQISVTATSTSTFTVTASNSAGSATGSTIVSVVAAPPGPGTVAPAGASISQSPAGPVSAGTVVTLTASCATGTAPIGYQWSTGQTGAQISVTAAATSTFVVTASNSAGSTQASVVVVVGSSPPIVNRNFEGLWWCAPAGSESGWGLNFSHQGDVIFATWFTYGASGEPLWLTVTARKTDEGTYAGPVNYTTGPAFNSMPFDPERVTVSTVGNATLAFTDAANGTFTYKVNAVTQIKPIVRMVFAVPVPACHFEPVPDLGNANNYQGLWWADPAGSESGWGINLNHQGDVIFATWFTYAADGTPTWLTTTAWKSPTGEFTGTLNRTTGPAFNTVPFDPTMVACTAVGEVTFTFTDGNSATFDYKVDSVEQTKQITRMIFATPATVCGYAF